MALPRTKDSDSLAVVPPQKTGYLSSDSRLVVFLEFQKDLFEVYKSLPFFYRIKTVMEPVIALLLLALLGLPMIFIALAIKLRMGSPILYKQYRVGQFGRVFYAYKFRTMRNGALNVVDMGYSPLDKVKNDPRVVGRLGSFLRKYKWDELPQLFNVLKGDMLLIGPRPYLYDENLSMRGQQINKFAVKPGISGLWQCGLKDVRGSDKFDVDHAYVMRLSLSQDLRIFFKTLSVVFIKGERL
jgi:sugar transferase EpsL